MKSTVKMLIWEFNLGQTGQKMFLRSLKESLFDGNYRLTWLQTIVYL